MTEADDEILEIAHGEASDCLNRIEATLLALESGTAEPDAIDVIFRDAHSIKGMAGMVGWKEVAAIAHVMEDRLSECRDRAEVPPALVEPLLHATDAVRDAVAGDPSGAAAAIEALGGTNPAAETAEQDRGSSGSGAGAARQAIRVRAEKVDRILDTVGETVLHHRRLEHILDQGGSADENEATARELALGERLLGELQDSVIDMRTLPLSSITAPFPRAVRDLAAEHGKEATLYLIGADTHLDRVILDGISEVISHLLRNAVAHGIEPPEDRERAGKPRVGRVELRAEQQGDMVSIEVADDGGGVSAEVLARVDSASSLTEVLAAPGFSTAGAVSEVAGRGVGLDAVRAHVEALGGSLEVRSRASEGTTATLLLPFTLALLEVLLCERGGERFGVPLSAVAEVVSVTETTSLGGRASIQLRGEAVRLADLAAVIGADAAGPLPANAPAFVLGSQQRAVALACDRVLGNLDVIVKSLGPLLASVPGYLGAAILGDGGVALILDPNHLVKATAAAPAPPAPPASAAEDGGGAEGDEPGDAVPARVLVVDDQFTVRELQRSILETAGYEVETAPGGQEALSRLAEGDVDLVMTDIEMPEMDGFELLAAIREHPAYSTLPVVIVTSRGDDESRRRGLEGGADGYMVKDQFDQRALLETIGRLAG